MTYIFATLEPLQVSPVHWLHMSWLAFQPSWLAHGACSRTAMSMLVAAAWRVLIAPARMATARLRTAASLRRRSLINKDVSAVRRTLLDWLQIRGHIGMWEVGACSPPGVRHASRTVSDQEPCLSPCSNKHLFTSPLLSYLGIFSTFVSFGCREITCPAGKC